MSKYIFVQSVSTHVRTNTGVISNSTLSSLCKYNTQYETGNQRVKYKYHHPVTCIALHGEAIRTFLQICEANPPKSFPGSRILTAGRFKANDPEQPLRPVSSSRLGEPLTAEGAWRPFKDGERLGAPAPLASRTGLRWRHGLARSSRRNKVSGRARRRAWSAPVCGNKLSGRPVFTTLKNSADKHGYGAPSLPADPPADLWREVPVHGR